MLQSRARLLELNAKLAETLKSKGVEATADETTTALINKVANISSDATFIKFNQMNEVVTNYLNNVKYDPSDYSTTQIYSYAQTDTTYRKDEPTGYDTGAKGDITITDNTANKSNTSTNAVIYNITPSDVGGYYVANADGKISAVGQIVPTGHLRMIYVPSIQNVRDLGGWTTYKDGKAYGAVKYGLLFRGGTLTNDDKTSAVTDEDLFVFRNLLGIKCEIDFATAFEKSVLGDDVDYCSYVTSYSYQNMVLQTEGVTALINALNKVFYNVAHNIPTYFHCTHGADRTGTLAFIIEALLDMSRSDIDKDYEITTLCHDIWQATGWRRRNDDTTWCYKTLVEYFMSLGKDNLRDNVTLWCTNNDIKISDINAFRQNMIDGSPDDISLARIPSEYQEVEYIENTSTSYIDTGIISKYGIKTKVGAQVVTTTTTYEAVIGAYIPNRDVVGFISNTRPYLGTPTEGTAIGSDADLIDATKYYDIETYRASDGYSKWGDTFSKDYSYSDFTNTVNYTLFCRNKGASQDYPFKGRIYYCKIYDNGTLVSNMIPCYRKSDNVIGMYDIVRNTFFTNNGDGTFTKGTDIN